MATKEVPKSGLLAKVARFVVNPTTDWTEIDAPPSQDSIDPRNADRKALKALIEHKRKNDFVRHREFTSLRKLRQKELGSIQGVDKSPDKTSFFQSSYPSRTDDKLVTLKKINDIEAQMSMQWWSTKHGNSTLPPPSTLHSQNFSSTLSHSDKSGFQSTSPGVVTVTGNSVLPIFENRQLGADSKPGFVNTQNAKGPDTQSPAKPAPSAPPSPQPLVEPDQKQPMDAAREEIHPKQDSSISSQFDADSLPPLVLPRAHPAEMHAEPPSNSADIEAEPVVVKPLAAQDHAAASSQRSYESEFSSSKGLALEVDEVTHDPDLEEAAIRFANGDFSGAQAALQDALQSRDTGLLNEGAWLALFDLYRATNNQTAFESLSIDYAGYFQRSPPQWISFLGQLPDTAPAPNDAPVAAHWKAPVALGIQSVATVKATLAKAASPWRVDWSRLIRIDEAALPQLIELIRQWCQSAGDQFRFSGTDVLMQLLVKATPPNVPQTAQNWWHLRMDVLRLLHRPDEFEIVALEYCITYEVSPPSWEPALCSCKLCDVSGATLQGGLTIIQAGSTNISSDTSLMSHSQHESSRFSEMSLRETTIELSGHIQGDPQEAIAMLDDALQGADIMVISCENLIRIDFSAAGALLNWVIARHQEGRQVHFVQLHRMILAFFNVIGIHEYALISVRLH